jgi:hypothetical protein
MTFLNFLIGLPAMLLCLIVQTAVAFWCVRHYVSHLPRVGSGLGFLAGMRPLIVATLAMLGGTLVLGMSAATLMAIVQHMVTLLNEARLHEGPGARE